MAKARRYDFDSETIPTYSLHGWEIYCPACKSIHFFPETRAEGAVWKFNGNYDKPSFTPSMVLKCNPPDHKHYNPECSSSVCHSIVTDGTITYCGDCTHDMAGKTVELPDIDPRP